jgi:MobA/MobL family protein
MGSAHLWVHNYSRASATQTAAEQVRYLQRQGEFNPVSYLQRSSPHTKDYTDFVCGETRNLPDWAEHDAGRFFMQAQKHERANGYYAVQVQFSLPRELTHEQQMALTRDFMDATMPHLPVLWVKHDKRLANGERHPHIHILLSAREMDGHQRSPGQTFARWNAKAPERGGAKKDLFWSKSHAPQQLRHAFADLTNYHLERAGHAERIDVRRLSHRGIDRRPIGRGSPQLDAHTHAKEHAQAYAAWEQRKAYKGIENVHEISPREFALRVHAWTREWTAGTAIRPSTVHERHAYQVRMHAKEQKLLRSIQSLEHELATLERERQRTRRGRPIHPWAREPEHAHSHAVKARVFGRSNDREGYDGYQR